MNGLGTPDFLTLDGDYPVELPNNTVFGEIYPHSGKGIMGFLARNSSSQSREYLIKELDTTMEIGETYHVSFWITSGITSFGPSGCDGVSLNFSTYELIQNLYDVVDVTPTFTIPDTFYSHQWVNYSFDFVADSAYKYISLGNFKYDSETVVTVFDTINAKHPASLNTAYYFLDDISVKLPEIETPDDPINIPNIFTPNNDGINDNYSFEISKKNSEIDFAIQNRWGETVYQSSDYQIHWDGKVNGVFCSEGTYFWILKYTDSKKDKKTESGFVNLSTYSY